ncbi:hypothetical protein HDK90DRAFT_490643 [Phyllosticta capitalensis]|uniref:Uncharacterized protein n=1 Tax=Phyllosticta capitalensis TaxID=121624 RepID=A0ABR1YHM5_9PEZI
MEGAARGCRQPQASTSMPTFSCRSNYGCWTTHALADPANSPLEVTSLLGSALASNPDPASDCIFQGRDFHSSAPTEGLEWKSSNDWPLPTSCAEALSARSPVPFRIYTFLPATPFLPPRHSQPSLPICLFGLRPQSVGWEKEVITPRSALWKLALETAVFSCYAVFMDPEHALRNGIDNPQVLPRKDFCSGVASFSGGVWQGVVLHYCVSATPGREEKHPPIGEC